MAIVERTGLNLVLRVRVALVLVFLAFFAIGLRLWYLQILRGDYFRLRSENNRLRQIYIPPPRGAVFSRDGMVLVKNRPAYNVELVKEDCGKCTATLSRLAEIAGEDFEKLKRVAVEPQKKRRRFEPRLILKDVDRDLVAKIAASKYSLPGVVVSVVPARSYVQGDFAAHVLGYIGEISGKQLDNPNYSGYRMGDLVGQYGVERVQEKLLHGRRGAKGIIVNAMGARISEAYYEIEKPGHILTLTLDFELQAAAEKAMEGLSGAVVALKAATGEILAIVSKPGFDPNIFSGGISRDLWSELTMGSGRAMNNRAVQGAYHPGSIFKFIVATAALAEGVVSPSETVYCNGAFSIGRSKTFHCHHTHGTVQLHDALKKSCNVYFYTMGQRLGVDRIHDYASRFGLGVPTGLELIEEQSGLIPSTKWKKERFSPPDDRWYPGETPSVSIGQGAVTVTPLQIARAMAALVNGGRLLRPYVVLSVETQDGIPQFQGEPFEQGRLGIEPWVLEEVKKGLVAVVNEPGGTGGRASLKKDLGIIVAGKTGTAQVRRLIGTTTLQEKDSLAWFSGFAPAQEPEIVVTALIEGGGHGGTAAAPVAKAVMAAYFQEAPGQQQGRQPELMQLAAVKPRQ